MDFYQAFHSDFRISKVWAAKQILTFSRHFIVIFAFSRLRYPKADTQISAELQRYPKGGTQITAGLQRYPKTGDAN